jgi:hypothetical protein
VVERGESVNINAWVEMRQTPDRTSHASPVLAPAPRTVGVLSALILLILLIAGLSPFHSLPNQASWLKAEDGLEFGDHGVIFSSGPLLSPALPERPCSIEVWMRPRLTSDENTILAFSNPANPVAFSLRQQISDLRIWRGGLDGGAPAVAFRDDLFARGGPILITLTAGPDGAVLYVDGERDRVFPQLRFSSGNLNGQVVFAGSPTDYDTWSGTVQGLAIYETELSPSQVRSHYASWSRPGHPEPVAAEQPVALYVFAERAGNRVHNLVNSAADLIIPQKFMLLRPTLLDLPWRAFRASRSYVQDLFVNVCGFIPFGFVMCWFFSVVLLRKHPSVAAVISGIALSFLIECLQVYLPTRHSDLTDVLTNTLGTCVGVAFYRLGALRGMVFAILAWAMRPLGLNTVPAPATPP